MLFPNQTTSLIRTTHVYSDIFRITNRNYSSDPFFAYWIRHAATPNASCNHSDKPDLRRPGVVERLNRGLANALGGIARMRIYDPARSPPETVRKRANIEGPQCHRSIMYQPKIRASNRNHHRVNNVRIFDHQGRNSKNPTQSEILDYDGRILFLRYNQKMKI